MGLYIEHPDKETFLKQHATPTLIPEYPTNPNQMLVCLVDNGLFKAAGVAFSPNEFRAFNSIGDTRLKHWFIVDKEVIKPYCPEWDRYEPKFETINPIYRN